MLRKACWAMAVIVVLAACALAQPPGQTEKLPPPAKIIDNLDSPGPDVFAAEPARPASLVFGDVDYLMWWVKHGPAPDLLTTAPNNGLNANGLTGGILGEPGTQVIFTGRDLEYHTVSGIRAKLGVYLADGFWSLEAGGFWLQKRSIDHAFFGGPNGAPLLTIPFLDAATSQQSSLDVSAQDAVGNPFLVGNIAFHSDLVVWGYEVNLRGHSIRTAERNIDVLFGFRALRLDENLNISQVITPTQDGNMTIQFPTAGAGSAFYQDVLANSPVSIVDRFSTRNHFYGPQVGGRFTWFFGAFSADLSAKVAVGVTHQQATIDGSSTAAAAINPNTLVVSNNLTTPGGVFALANNSGSFSQNQFTVVPEIGVNLKFAATSWLRLQVGYSALYWSNVARPGAQIDTVLNSKLVPTGALLPTNTVPVGAFIPGAEQGRPYFAFRDTAFWAHGVNFGVELRY